MISKASPPAKTSTTVALVVAVDPAGVDFAKQLLTLVGTLMTAVHRLLFGAKTAAGAAQGAGDGAGKPAADAAQHCPVTSNRAEGPFSLTIAGDNFNTVTSVKIVQGNVQIDATGVHFPTPTRWSALPDSTVLRDRGVGRGGGGQRHPLGAPTGALTVA